MFVLKFGGTSMGSCQSINQNVLPIVKNSLAKGQKPVVVVSAMTGTTNDLIASTQNVVDQREINLGLIDKIRQRHLEVINQIQDQSCKADASSFLEMQLNDLKNLLQAFLVIEEVPPKSFDAIVAIGEKLSAKVFSAVLTSNDIPALYCDFDRLIPKSLKYRDDKYWDEIAAILATEVKQAALTGVPVATGFFGRTENGIIQDVGRGYSDYCASLLGAGLKSPEVQIWTDVNGVLSANPKVVPQAFINRVMSFDEMAELATFGAKVLHPFSVRPAVNAGIPIRILNTFESEDPGTLITTSPEICDQPFKSIACKAGVSLVRISTPQMLLAHGFVLKLGQILADHQVSVDLISTSEVSVSFSIERGPENLQQFVADLQQIGEVNLKQQQSIISLVGKELEKYNKTISRALTALENNQIAINMISMNNLRINLSLVVDDAQADMATRLLHQEFFN